MTDTVGMFVVNVAVVFGATLLGAAIDEFLGVQWFFAIVLSVLSFFYKFIWTASNTTA